jgi:hypothetical protein
VVAQVEVLDVACNRLDQFGGDLEPAGLIVLRVWLGGEALAGRAVLLADLHNDVLHEDRPAEEVDVSDAQPDQLTPSACRSRWRPAP